MRVVAAQAAGAVPHRVVAAEMAAHENAEPGTGATAGLLGHLQGQPVGGDDVVPADNPFVLQTEDLIEVDPAERDEGRRGVSGGPGELLVELWEEVIAQVPVGGGQSGDAGHAQLVDEAPLQGAIDALAAAAGLGGVAEDMLDAAAGPGRGRPG